MMDLGGYGQVLMHLCVLAVQALQLLWECAAAMCSVILADAQQQPEQNGSKE